MKSLLPRIVLAEDNQDDELICRRAVDKSKIPCEFVVKRDGADALEYLVKRGDSVALVVLDYNLPRKTGKEILVQLRKREVTRFTPIVIFSGGNGGPAFAECYREGANSCVEKPNSAADYMDAMHSIVHYWLRVNQGCTSSEEVLNA